MNLSEIKELYGNYVLNTYFKQDLCLVKGRGAKVEDSEGKKYLDFFPGWAVSGIGHCHPLVVKRVKEQLSKIMHVSNNFYSELQPLLAKKIIEYSFPGRVFFANSGAEANEGAIKLARKYGSASGRYEIITMEKSFHGRTMAAISATGQDKVKHGFEPLLEGFKHVPFNDINAVLQAVTPKTVAVMVEPIQGEGGINVPDKEYMKALSAICKEKDLLLILDEVQTCMGRTGEMFAYRLFDVEPAAITLAKSLGGGMPIGALVVAERFKDVLVPGNHASTFGGSPIVCSAALAVFEAIENEGLLENTRSMGEYLREKLEKIKKKTGLISKVKGHGLMVGVELNMEDGGPLAVKCLGGGLLINCTQKNILRIMPPMNVGKKDIDKAMKILQKAMESTQ
ncbi:MAG: aspartate aminotransferase family protein [Candidatus Omnitrophica bacterium]|nr:aspartate aminotransferase family protein [Candidatus Omnitrophota bacterium]